MITKVKQWWKSRTIKTATFIALLGVLEMNFQYLQSWLGEYYGISWIVFSMIMVMLRSITTQPIEEKQ